MAWIPTCMAGDRRIPYYFLTTLTFLVVNVDLVLRDNTCLRSSFATGGVHGIFSLWIGNATLSGVALVEVVVFLLVGEWGGRVYLSRLLLWLGYSIDRRYVRSGTEKAYWSAPTSKQ